MPAHSHQPVMPGHSRSKNDVASLAYVPAIHELKAIRQNVDGRDKPSHHEEKVINLPR